MPFQQVRKCFKSSS